MSLFADFPDFEVSIPSKEERRAERQKAYDWTRERLLSPEAILLREPGQDGAQINLLSLPAWLAVAQRAGVEFIPARLLASIPTESYIEAFDHVEGSGEGENAAAAAYRTFHETVIRDLADGEMVRMEQVAPRDVKSEVASGAPMTNGLISLIDNGGLYLDLLEDRYYTTLKDLGSDQVRAFARPIMKPSMIDGTFWGKPGKWAAEFRVYVEDGRIVGISNYYPQVSMDPQVFTPAAAQARDMAQRMIDTMDALHLCVGNHSLARDLGPKACMWQRPDWQQNTWASNDFTLDFMVLEDGRVVFLEGGPAGMSAAHPCCFLQEGRQAYADFLHGVAWSDTMPIQPLSTLD